MTDAKVRARFGARGIIPLLPNAFVVVRWVTQAEFNRISNALGVFVFILAQTPFKDIADKFFIEESKK